MIECTTRSGRTSVREFDHHHDVSAFTSVVSLHAHTHHSRESLADVEVYLAQVPVVGHRCVHKLQACLTEEGCGHDYSRVWWHPPVSARAVFESESDQIQDRLGLSSLVSVTDYDDIVAGLELFGMNVGGLPLQNHAEGFWILVVLVTALSTLGAVLALGRSIDS
jgi:hypothetical protein